MKRFIIDPPTHQKWGDLKKAILNEEVDGIVRMLRTGAQLLSKHHQNFPNAPHGSAIFEHL